MTKLSNFGDAQFLFNQAKSAPQLDRDLEATLIERWQAGDAQARDTLVRCHQRYVVALALKYRHYGVPVSELVAEGNVGVVLALARFQPERGVRFGTYAAHWVKAQMLACVVKSGRAVSGSDGPLRSQLFFKLRRERARVFNLLGPGDAADRELATRLGLSLERVQRMNQRLDARDVAVDEHLAAPQDQERELFEQQLGQSLGNAVQRALADLDPRERGIIEQRYLHDGEPQRSLAEIARRLRISRERVRQLEQRAITKLRRRLGSTTDPVLRDWLEQEVVTTAA